MMCRSFAGAHCCSLLDGLRRTQRGRRRGGGGRRQRQGDAWLSYLDHEGRQCGGWTEASSRRLSLKASLAAAHSLRGRQARHTRVSLAVPARSLRSRPDPVGILWRPPAPVTRVTSRLRAGRLAAISGSRSTSMARASRPQTQPSMPPAAWTVSSARALSLQQSPCHRRHVRGRPMSRDQCSCPASSATAVHGRK